MSQNNTSKLFFHWKIFFGAAANAGLQKQYWIMFHVAYLLWHGLSLSPVIFVCLPSILQLGVRRINVAVILKVRVVFSSKKSLGFRGITTEGLLIHLLNSGWCFQATKPESVKLQQLFLEGPVMLLKPRQPPPPSCRERKEMVCDFQAWKKSPLPLSAAVISEAEPLALADQKTW